MHRKTSFISRFTKERYCGRWPKFPVDPTESYLLIRMRLGTPPSSRPAPKRGLEGKGFVYEPWFYLGPFGPTHCRRPKDPTVRASGLPSAGKPMTEDPVRCLRRTLRVRLRRVVERQKDVRLPLGVTPGDPSTHSGSRLTQTRHLTLRRPFCVGPGGSSFVSF